MSIIKKTTKVAISIALVMGNITPPSDNYYEDDHDFDLVSNELKSGWGWGFNKAFAWCHDQATSSQECYVVTGKRPRDTVFRDTSEFVKDEPIRTQGGSGGSGSKANPSNNEKAEKCRKCELKADVIFSKCEAKQLVDFSMSLKDECKPLIASSIGIGVGKISGGLTYDPYGRCINEIASIRDASIGTCKVFLATQKLQC